MQRDKKVFFFLTRNGKEPSRVNQKKKKTEKKAEGFGNMLVKTQ
jgi:hypothetical protein